MRDLIALIAQPDDLSALPQITDERMEYAVTMAALAVGSLEPADRSALAQLLILAKGRCVYSPGIQTWMES